MGRTKKEEGPASATKGLDSKSKGIEKSKVRQTRERAQKSYREHSESEEEPEPAFKDEDVQFSDAEGSPSDSGSDWGGESSGSEYGKRKSKSKKIKAVGGRGRGRKPAASPKGKGRGRAPAKGKAKAKASPASSRNGSRKVAAKRYRDDSESESEAASSGSEYGGKKPKPSPKKSRPMKSAPSPSPRGSRGRPKAAAKSYKEISEDDFSEEEAPKKSAPKKFKKDLSDEEEVNKSGESGSDKETKLPAKSKPAAAAASKPSKNGTDDEEEDDLDEKVDDKKSKNKDSDVAESGEGSESEEEKPKEKSKEKPKEKPAAKVAEKSKVEEKNGTDDEDDEEDEEMSLSEEEPQMVDEATTLKNRSETDYGAIDFECIKKTAKGEDWNFKISCWNVGGIKSWIKKNQLQYLEHENPDIMCLQEIKCSDKTKPPEVKTIPGYPFVFWEYAQQSGHHGVAIISKTEPKKVINGLPVEDSDSESDKKAKEKFNEEGRLLTAEYESFYLINAYVPNAGRAVKDDKHPKGYPPKVSSGERQEFDKYFRQFVKSLEEKKPVIVAGDLNVSHAEIDLANPKTNTNTAGFTKEERDGMTELMEETKLVDSFRKLYPDKKNAYTFWSYMHNSRAKNTGWRLDYFLLSEKLTESLCENLMRTEVFGSDHCPLVLFLKV